MATSTHGWMTAGVASRGRRLVSAALAIILGAAFLAASLVVISSASAGMERAVAGPLREADLVVAAPAPGEGTLDADAYDAVATLPEVGTVTGETFMAGLRPNGDYLPGAALPTTGATLLEGALPDADGEIAVNTHLRKTGVDVGDTLTLAPMAALDQEAAQPVELLVTGVLDPGEGSTLNFGPTFMASDATLRLVDPDLGYGTIQLQAADGTAVDDLRAAVEAALPGAQLRTGAEAAEQRVAMLTGGTAVMALMLLGFGAVALATAAMVIANTFTITLAQRAADLALLRCVGATTAQVRRLVLVEAAVLGVVSSLVGTALGVAAAYGLVALGRRLDVGMPLGAGVEMTPLALVVPVVAGTVVTLLAGLLPAVRATRVSPLAALRPAGPGGERPRVRWVRAGVGALLVAAGVALMLVAAREREVVLGIGGGLLSFAGVLVAAVVVVPLAVRGLGLGARVAGVPGRLAVDNAVRNPGRAAATSAALLVGVTLITMTTVGAATGQRTALGEIDDAYAVDLIASGSGAVASQSGSQEAADGAGTAPTALGDPAVARLADVDGVAAAEAVPTAYLTLGEAEQPTLAIGLDAADATVVRSADQLAALQPGTLGLSNTLQAIHGLPPGSTVRLTGAEGSREVTVVELGLGDALAVNATDLQALAGDGLTGAGAALVRVDDDADAADVKAAVGEITDPLEATVSGSLLERATITQVLDIMVLVATALLGVAVVIAVVGIANTLSLSVIERQREHALLRGMGLTRGQMRTMLLVEGVLLAVVSALVGLVLGLLYARLGIETILPADTPVRLAVPWARVGLIVGLALLAGILASVLPARRAARVSPAEGLAAA